MIKANIITGHSNWKKFLRKPNDYIKKGLINYLKRTHLKEKTMNSLYF